MGACKQTSSSDRDDNPAPEGDCACREDAEGPCDHCYAMMLWAEVELYGEDDPGHGDEPYREAMDEWAWDDDEE